MRRNCTDTGTVRGVVEAAPERGTRDAGAGLGLAGARGVIESHAGSISVANVDGGCCFDVELPAQEPA